MQSAKFIELNYYIAAHYSASATGDRALNSFIVLTFLFSLHAAHHFSSSWKLLLLRTKKKKKKRIVG